MADQGYPLEVSVREVIKEVMSLTCENFTDLGRAIGMSGALVGRRQSGVTQWGVPELGRLGEHWGIPASCLLTNLKTVLTALPEQRVAQLRAAKGHQPVPFKPSTVVAA